MMIQKSFTKSHLFRKVTGQYQGKAAWWILQLEPLKASIFEKDVALGRALALDRYGAVLEKGYGENPPETSLRRWEATLS